MVDEAERAVDDCRKASGVIAEQLPKADDDERKRLVGQTEQGRYTVSVVAATAGADRRGSEPWSEDDPSQKKNGLSWNSAKVHKSKPPRPTRARSTRGRSDASSSLG